MFGGRSMSRDSFKFRPAMIFGVYAAVFVLAVLPVGIVTLCWRVRPEFSFYAENVAWFGSALFFYGGFAAVLVARIGALAGTIRCADGVKRCPADELIAALKSLNAPRSPLTVSDGPRGRLLVGWRLDDDFWKKKIQAAGPARIDRMTLKISRDGIVRARDESGELLWRAAPDVPLAAHVGWRGPRIISFAHATLYDVDGIVFTDGRFEFAERCDVRFRAGEMRKLLVTAVTASGWNWRPVVSFIGFIGG